MRQLGVKVRPGDCSCDHCRGLVHLSGLPLEALNLSENAAVRDRGLASLSRLTRLASLDLSYTSARPLLLILLRCAAGSWPAVDLLSRCFLPHARMRAAFLPLPPCIAPSDWGLQPDFPLASFGFRLARLTL